jgi:hypothetical protein
MSIMDEHNIEFPRVPHRNRAVRGPRPTQEE